MWNRHRESENTKLVQVRNFITFELKVIRQEKRETQSFYADCVYIVSSQPKQNPQPTLPGMTSFPSPCHICYLGFYFDIPEWHILSTRSWTPALMLYLTNPCTKRKVLILTKPKGKIHNTKSLRHYITRG